MMRRLLFGFTLAAACATSTPAVDLSGQWPSRAPAYDDAHERWTRTSRVTDGLDFIMSVDATALAPEFRTAYVAERARRLHLPDAARDQLIADEKAADAEFIEFQILFATGNHPWNDLSTYPRSMWRVSLIGDDGREVLPEKIEPDKRQRAEIAEYFPGLGSFHKPYRVTFPRNAADGRPLLSAGSKRMKLVVAGSLGTAEMVWTAQ
jgi:hypothetical protein